MFCVPDLRETTEAPDSRQPEGRSGAGEGGRGARWRSIAPWQLLLQDSGKQPAPGEDNGGDAMHS